MSQSPNYQDETLANTNGNGSSKFDQPVVLRQSPALSRAIVWVILALTVSSVTWAAIAKIEQVVTATGKLQPKEDVKEVQTPINGVVKEVLVKDGDRVTKGQPLLTFDSDTAKANKASLLIIKQSLEQENQLYRAVMQPGADPQALETQINTAKLPPEVTALARNRLSLVAQTQVLRAQLGNSSGSLSPDQSARLAASQQEYASKVGAANFALQQLQKRLAQNQVQLADSRTQLRIDRDILSDINDRNKKSVAEAEKSLQIEKDIFERISPLAVDGAVAELQVKKQQQQINDRLSQLIDTRSKGDIEVQQQQQRIDKGRADISQLLKEEQRLQLNIQQAKEEMINAQAAPKRTFWEQLDAAKQQLAAIDSEMTKQIVENTKRLSEVESQLAQAEEILKYETITAPIAGTVFDLKASPSFVPRAGQADPLLKIVPGDDLIAEVYVTNKDIGFVLNRCLGRDDTKNDVKPAPTPQTQGDSLCTNHVRADVRIDSFSYSKYSSIDGEVLSIGSDALPPDQIYPYYRFPVKIKLDRQNLNGLRLQSGMSVNVNLIIREKRSVLSLMTDLFSQKQDALKRSE